MKGKSKFMKQFHVKLYWMWLFFFISLVSLLAVRCKADNRKTLFYEECFVNPIEDILPEVLPDFYPEAYNNSAFVHLYQGAVCELLDTQAILMLEKKIIRYWYPQYQATVVIAVDREKTDEIIHGWNSLCFSKESIGFMSNGTSDAEFVSAASVGPTDLVSEKEESYISKTAINLFAKLHKENRFSYNDADAAILICFDYQAVALKKLGRKIEIVVPEEGTRSYTFGFASNEELKLPDNVPELFVAAGFRLPDGRMDQIYYPSNDEYQSVVPVTDFEKYEIDTADIDKIVDRNIMHTRLCSSADGWEHQIFAAVFLVVLLFWSGILIRRILQLKLRKLLLASSAMMGGWFLIRFVKYLIIEIDWKIRYAWYAFYIFILGIPILILWFMLETDGKEAFCVPVWVRKVVFTIYLCLLAMVFTNDFHMLVFKMDLSNTQWCDVYQYGPLYWIIVTLIIGMLGIAVCLLITKSEKKLHGKEHIFPITFLCLFIAYGAGYNLDVPFVKDSDFTMTAGIFYMLFFETAMQSGLIMINKEYGRIFVQSSLKMQIYDKDRKLWLASGKSENETENNQDILCFEENINGGIVTWQEDISEVRKLQNQIKNNARFISQLEEEIHDKMLNLSEMIENLPKDMEKQRTIGKITLMLCYIKRRCNLFFREREQEQLPAQELKFYLDEITEFAKYAGVRYLAQCDINCNISTRQAALFYDFVHEVLTECCDKNEVTILVMLQMEGNNPILKLLPSIPLKKELLDQRLIENVREANGRILFKDLGETSGISLIFTDGG